MIYFLVSFACSLAAMTVLERGYGLASIVVMALILFILGATSYYMGRHDKTSR